jgi:N-acetylmuramic acid 6-phosphate etherase
MGGDPRHNVIGIHLGIEGGGTRTVALFADPDGRPLRRVELGPLNLRLSTDHQITTVLRSLRRFKYPVSKVALCLAGCRTVRDRSRVRTLVGDVFPKAQCIVGCDLDSGFAAAFGLRGRGILVISGTGSCVYGRNALGHTARAGGWGHLLGDHGSGYWIVMEYLQSSLRDYDRTAKCNRFLQNVLRRLSLNSPDQLVDWIQTARKPEVSALASEVGGGNRVVLREAARHLADDCILVAKKLRLTAPEIALAGGVFANHPALFRFTARRILHLLPGARVFRSKRESAVGTLVLAGWEGGGAIVPAQQKLRTIALTEQRNPRTTDLHKRSVPHLVDTMLGEEARVIPALRKNKRTIERAVNSIVAAFKRGGRLLYVGAGTSGRLGVLDASECPPTFSTDPRMVQGIIAGGAPALHSPVEAAEDDPAEGAEAMRHRGVGRKDVVVGIAASGSTPFVLGALDEAKTRGAKTFCLSFSPPPNDKHELLLFNTGPEIITGSTRLKAGTATKLVLNMLTTISMIRFGKVVSNLMVDVKPTNEKLRARACRIVAMLLNCTEEEARRRLVRSGWNVKRALR